MCRLEGWQDLVTGDRTLASVCLLYEGLETTLAEAGRDQSRNSVHGLLVFDVLAGSSSPVVSIQNALSNGVDNGVLTGINEGLTLNYVCGKCAGSRPLLILREEEEISKQHTTDFAVADPVWRLARDLAYTSDESLDGRNTVTFAEKLPGSRNVEANKSFINGATNDRV